MWTNMSNIDTHETQDTTGCITLTELLEAIAQVEPVDASELPPSVASPGEYLHYICKSQRPCMLSGFWRDALSPLLLFVKGHSFSDDGAVEDYIPACTF